MKKIYQTPVTILVSIGTTPLLTNSVEDGFNPSGVPETDAINGNLSRRGRRGRHRDVWDDEEEEEEY